MSSVILVKNTLSGSLIDRLHCDLVCALGLGAIAFCGSSLELLESSLQCGLVGLIAGVADLSDLDALLGRLILAKFTRNCKPFLNFFFAFLYDSKLCG